MPAKNRVKLYFENGYYHLYNRGVEKRNIFEDEEDFGVFLSFLKEYLSVLDRAELIAKLQDADPRGRAGILFKLGRNNFYENIELLSYCLMPNHFHFLLKQKEKNGIAVFMQSLLGRYVHYFNTKYKRVGGLFQGTYKAVVVDNDSQLLHLSRYIHRNPDGLPGVKSFLEYDYSSIKNFLGLRKAEWLNPDLILDFFSKTNKDFSYDKFVCFGDQEELLSGVKELALDFEEDD